MSDHVYAKPFKNAVSDELRYALQFFRDRLLTGLPRSINMATRHTRFVLTDACLEANLTGGIGGVLCSPKGQVEIWFQLKLEPNQVEHFMAQLQENAIAELETLATVVAMKLWASVLCSQHVVFCLDNDAIWFDKRLLKSAICNFAGATCLHIVRGSDDTALVFEGCLTF